MVMKEKIDNLKRHWREGLGFRLSVFIMSITLVLFVMTMSVCVYVTESMTTEETIDNTKDFVEDNLDLINAVLNNVETTVETTSLFTNTFIDTPDKTYQLCENILKKNDDIYAVTMMFRPDYFKGHPQAPYVSKDSHLFCPTVYYDEEKGKYIHDNLIRESDDDFYYIKEDSNWVNSTIYDKGYWCEPYFDHYSTEKLLVSFSYPVHDDDGSICAVICADVPLQWLAERMDSLNPTENTDVTILSQTGHFLVHNNPEFVRPADGKLLGFKIYDMTEGTAEEIDFGKKLMSDKKFMERIESTIYLDIEGKRDTINPCYLIHSPIEKTGWLFSSFTPLKDIYSVSDTLTSRLIILAVIGLVFMACSLYLMVRKMIEPYKKFAAVDADIKTAATIQNSMIPKTFPEKEQLLGNELCAFILPAKSVGGDLYDFFLNGNKLYFVLGDVSGKGVPASLFMAQACTLFRVASEQYDQPADIITYINDRLARHNEMSMFVTMFVGVLDLESGHLNFCNGGHNAPVLVHDSQSQFMNVQTNLPVGVIEDMPFVQESADLGAGDVLFVYTDGVTEAENIKAELFGDDKLVSLMHELGGGNAKKICDKVVAEVRHHAGDAEQSDDITVLCIKRN